MATQAILVLPAGCSSPWQSSRQERQTKRQTMDIEEGLFEPEAIPGGSYEFGKSMVLPPRGRASWLETDVDYPDWTNQRHRCFVPCLHTQEFHWVRMVSVTSLGLLFKYLGKKFSAKEILSYYLSLRPVVIKYSRSLAAATHILYCATL